MRVSEDGKVSFKMYCGSRGRKIKSNVGVCTLHRLLPANSINKITLDPLIILTQHSGTIIQPNTLTGALACRHEKILEYFLIFIAYLTLFVNPSDNYFCCVFIFKIDHHIGFQQEVITNVARCWKMTCSINRMGNNDQYPD